MKLIINQNSKEIVNEENLDDEQIETFLKQYKEKEILSIY